VGELNRNDDSTLIKKNEKTKLKSGPRTIIFLIGVILIIFLLSILFPQISRNISRIFTRLGIYIPFQEVPDTEPPQYFDVSTNSTIAGTVVEFRLRWTDNVSLSGYILTLDNGNTTFVNYTWTEMTGTENWSNKTETVNSTVDTTIRWIVYANDSSDNWNTSDIYSFNTVSDTIDPTWTSNVTSVDSPSYSPGQFYQFNVTWGDNVALDTVFVEHNFTSSLHNDSFNGSERGEYYLNVSDLAVDRYVWRSYANDSSDNWNKTDQWVYEVDKYTTEISLYLNGTRGNESYEPNQTANFTVNLDVSGKNVNLTANITGFVNQTGSTPLMNYTNLTSVGVFNITGYWLGDTNYSSDSETWYATVSTSTTSTTTTAVTTIPINYIVTNETVVKQGKTVNITGWSDDLSSTTYLWNNYNGTFLSMLPSGSGVQSNFTKTNNLLGVFNVSCNSTYNSSLASKLFIVVTTVTTTTSVTTTSVSTSIATTIGATSTVSACALTGEECESNFDCCSYYCCDGVCSDESCEKESGLGMYITIAVVGASVPAGYFIYTKFIRKVPVKVKPAVPVRVPYAKELSQELSSLRTITQRLRLQGYDVRTCENELALAENALRNGLPGLTRTHLRKVKQLVS